MVKSILRVYFFFVFRKHNKELRKACKHKSDRDVILEHAKIDKHGNVSFNTEDLKKAREG